MYDLAKVQFAVSSRDRDASLYPDSNDYNLVLDRNNPLKNVVNLQILEVVVPKTQPAVHPHNCALEFEETGGESGGTADLPMRHAVTVPWGNYSVADLVQTLTEGLNADPVSGTRPWSHKYSFEVNTVTLRATIRARQVVGDERVRFKFGTGEHAGRSLHRILGFEDVDTTLGESCTGTLAVDLSSSPFVDIRIDEIPNAATKKVFSVDRWDSRRSQLTNYVSARVPLDVTVGNIKYYRAKDRNIMDNLFPPMKLPNLSVRFYDHCGRLYVTQGSDHYIMFEATVLRKRDDQSPESLYSLPPRTTASLVPVVRRKTHRRTTEAELIETPSAGKSWSWAAVGGTIALVAGAYAWN